jgi:nitroreductase
MDALDNILNRVSSRELSLPHPNPKEMALAYKAALRAPDHAWLRPSSFIEVKGDGLSKLAKILKIMHYQYQILMKLELINIKRHHFELL